MNGDALESLKSCAAIHESSRRSRGGGGGGGLIKTPSTSSNTSSMLSPSDSIDQQQHQNQHDFTEPRNLLAQIESYKTTLNSTHIARRPNQVSTRLLYDSTAVLLTPAPASTLAHDFNRVYLLDKSFCFNSMLLLPFRFLLLNRRLDPTLKDTSVSAVCELVETSGARLKTSWKFLFACLTRIELNLGESSRSKKSKTSTRTRGGGQRNRSSSSSAGSPFSSSPSSSSQQSDANSDDDDNNELASTSSDEGLHNHNLSFSATFRFDSVRTRMSSLTHIFNTYLSLAAASEFVLASGGYGFLACISSFLRRQQSILQVKLDATLNPPMERLFFEFACDEFDRSIKLDDPSSPKTKGKCPVMCLKH